MKVLYGLMRVGGHEHLLNPVLKLKMYCDLLLGEMEWAIKKEYGVECDGKGAQEQIFSKWNPKHCTICKPWGSTTMTCQSTVCRT